MNATSTPSRNTPLALTAKPAQSNRPARADRPNTSTSASNAAASSCIATTPAERRIALCSQRTPNSSRRDLAPDRLDRAQRPPGHPPCGGGNEQQKGRQPDDQRPDDRRAALRHRVERAGGQHDVSSVRAGPRDHPERLVVADRQRRHRAGLARRHVGDRREADGVRARRDHGPGPVDDLHQGLLRIVHREQVRATRRRRAGPRRRRREAPLPSGCPRSAIAAAARPARTPRAPTPRRPPGWRQGWCGTGRCRTSAIVG